MLQHGECLLLPKRVFGLSPTPLSRSLQAADNTGDMAANASCADCAPALGLPIAGGMAGQLVHSLLSLLWLLLGGSPCRVSPPPASGHHSAYPTHLFPTDVGFVGATRTGGVPYLRATDPVAGTTGIGAGTTTARVPQPLETEFPVADGAQPDFHPVDYWGNVKPYAPAAGGFGAKEFALPLTCTVQQAHYLHRHGARYPTSGSSFTPQVLYGALQEAIEAASFEGPLEFLNAWNYTQLGSDILTPVGNQQEFDSGVAAYYRHGGLLRKRADPQRRMVARTTSQSRMLSSAKYFLSGFFGLDFLAHVNLEVIVESEGFNNTLEPFYACPRSTSNSTRHSRVWIDKYMQPAAERLSSHSPHHAWTAYEAFLAQLMCPYETNALGYSAFCSLFTEDEWRGFAYASDLDFYRMSFGADFGPALGIGYVNELLRRVQGTPYDPHTQTSENGELMLLLA